MTFQQCVRALSPCGFRLRRRAGLIVLWWHGQSWEVPTPNDAFDLACEIIGEW